MAEGDIRAATLQHLDAAFAEAEKSPDAAVPTLLNWDLQRAEHIGALRKAVEVGGVHRRRCSRYRS
ncbi:MAG: hypothetical protein IPG67_16895 [Acidobacteria bacterium]|nr:hypothetical protein [Acidobacteriota bacterium]